MILTSFQLLGRETVIEFSREQSWKSWEIIREGERDTHLFLGKFSLVHSKLWKKKHTSAIGAAVFGAALVGALMLSMTSVLVIPAAAYNGPINGPLNHILPYSFDFLGGSLKPD